MNHYFAGTGGPGPRLTVREPVDTVRAARPVNARGTVNVHAASRGAASQTFTVPTVQSFRFRPFGPSQRKERLHRRLSSCLLDLEIQVLKVSWQPGRHRQRASQVRVVRTSPVGTVAACQAASTPDKGGDQEMMLTLASVRRARAFLKRGPQPALFEIMVDPFITLSLSNLSISISC